MKEQLFDIGKQLEYKLCDISDYIYNNPEPGNKEYKAVDKLTSFLAEYDFIVNRDIPNIGTNTAFEAVYDSNKPGQSVAFFVSTML